MSITVFTSVHKNSKFFELKKCIESIINQSFKPDLLLVCVDGPISSDIENYLRNIEKIPLKIVRNNLNLGLSKSFNNSFNFIYTRYIAKIDSDDWMDHNRILNQLNFLEINSDIDILGSYSFIYDSFNDNYYVKKYPILNQDIYNEFKYRDPINHSSVTFRTSLFKKIGLYNERYLNDQDTELWFRAIKFGIKFHNLPIPLTYFREENTFSRRSSHFRLFIYFKLRLMILKNLNYGFNAYLYLFIYILYYLVGGFLFKKFHLKIKYFFSKLSY